MKKALLVGINKYSSAPLNGCINDVVGMFQVLTTKFDFKADNIKVITDHEANRTNILNGLSWLTAEAKEDDTLVFDYSGHGSQVNVTDLTDNMEVDRRDEIICDICLDWSNPIRDHQIGAFFKNTPKTCDIFVLLDSCLAKNTLIPLLNGTTKTIEELSKIEGTYWVYSSTEDGIIVPGLAHSARITGYRELLKITLDNDETFECTEDHLIMLKDGTYKKAIELTTEDSLMPLYRKLSIKTDGLIGYEMCFVRDKWEFTHRIVRDGLGLKHGLEKNKTICHHKDVNKLNNSPENLEMMTWKDHSKMHGTVGAANFKHVWKHNKEFIEWRHSDIYRKQQSYIIKEKWQDPEYRELMITASRNGKRGKDGFNQDRERLIKMNKDPEMIKKQGEWRKTEKGRLKLRNDMIAKNKNPEFKLKSIRNRILSFINTTGTLNDYNLKKPQTLPRIENIYKYFTIDEDIVELARNYNHKIISIEKTGKIEDVYDLTVDKYHNFAINSGVFVHNCHSGSGLRNILGTPIEIGGGPTVVNRFIPPPLSNVLLNPALIINEDLTFQYADPIINPKAAKPRFLVSTAEQGDAVLISGCRDDQTSADAYINGRYNGAATFSLINTLTKYNFDLSYEQLITGMNDYMIKNGYTQNPQLECKSEFFSKKFLK